MLQYRNFSEPFLLTTDASFFALGCVLSQRKIWQDLPIACASRTLTPAEVKYSVTDKEFLAIIFALEHFRPYLYGGHKVNLESDHKALLWVDNLAGPDRVQHWKLKLRDYNYEMVFKEGKLNKNADSL